MLSHLRRTCAPFARHSSSAATAFVVLSAAVLTAASPAAPPALISTAAGVAGRALADVAEHAARPDAAAQGPAEPQLIGVMPAASSPTAVDAPRLRRPRRTDRGWLIDAPPSPRPRAYAFRQQGRRIALDRDDSKSCEAWRLREWVQLRCGTLHTSAAQVAGNLREVSMWVHRTSDATRAVERRTAVFVFPVRPGDMRMFQATGEQTRYGGTRGLTIQQSWHPGHEPRIVVSIAM